MARRKRYTQGSMEQAYKKSLILDDILGFSNKTKEDVKMVKEVKLQQKGEVTVVKLLDNGDVEVSRDDMKTVVSPKFTFEEAVEHFKGYGWSEPSGIPAYMQTEVDEYIKQHEEMSKLKADMDKKKKNIRQYMEQKDLTFIKGTNGKQVYFQDATASNSTSVFTDYDLAALMAAIKDTEFLKKVVEPRVNSETLEAELTLSKLPKAKVDEILALKIKNPGTPRFSVKK